MMEHRGNGRISLMVLMAVAFLAYPAVGVVEAARRPISRLPAIKGAITSPVNGSTASSPVQFSATLTNGVAPFSYRWSFPRGTPPSQFINGAAAESHVTVAYLPGKYTATLLASDAKRRSLRATVSFTVGETQPPPPPPPPPPPAAGPINSTSANAAAPPTTPVLEQPFVPGTDFVVVAVNDLGMHCGDLDHRIASILPPFNVLHAQVIRKGLTPQILDPTQVKVVYSATSNSLGSAPPPPPVAPVYKTNFWDLNPRSTGNTLAFDAYNPFYPPGILGLFPLTVDRALPVPDVARLYLGDGQLVAAQQNMPGQASPFSANDPLPFLRFDANLPFFVGFPFGYILNGVNWFAADGIPVAPVDDSGRRNPYPLMRVQAKAAQGNALGIPVGTILASVDTVTPVAGESDCYRCHTSASDGGTGAAACIPGVDPGCAVRGSPRSGTAFIVATASEDATGMVPEVRREWAADLNILRLHDAKEATNLAAGTPVVCQRCHYTPALDLAHVGPKGPGDADANGREQRIHRSNSRVMHEFHSQFTDLFSNDMPPPNDPRRIDPNTGKPVVNAFVLEKLNQTCYQCHPGKETRCLRGRMYQAGLVCQDCHGSMQQVGNDFSVNMSAASPFPGGIDLSRRVPWAHEPGCQSCHTGDAVDNLGLTDPNVTRAADGIRLMQAYRTTAAATPIVALNRRFAENATPDGKQVLYRLSKGHGGLFCEACHGSTHAEWPVQLQVGQFVANDNLAAFQIQGSMGTIMVCATCHTQGALPLSLDGPHGLHPVRDSRWTNGHEAVAQRSLDACKTCHGVKGEGTVLSNGVRCNECHQNPIGAGGTG
jgi:hypothetical protein